MGGGGVPFLVVQWIRIRLQMQGIQVRSLFWEDATYHRATRPVPHNHWAVFQSREPQRPSPSALERVLLHKRSHRDEQPAHCN